MGYKYFNLKASLFVLMIGIDAVLISLVARMDNMLITTISLSIIGILLLLGLLRLAKQTNRELALFFEAVKFADDSIHFAGSVKSNNPLLKEFNRIVAEFRNARIATESQHQYFETTVEHVPVGLLSFDDSGQIKIFNPAVETLLKIKKPARIRSLSATFPELFEMIEQLPPGKSDSLKLNIGNNIVPLAIRVAEIKIQKKTIKLISLQNISAELEQGEVDSWQKMIKIVTHEIVNSVSPITLLSSNLLKSLPPNAPEEMGQSLEAIHKRSKGLSRFVGNYKSLAEIPEPIIESFKLIQLFRQTATLMKEQLNGIDFKLYCDEDLKITADEKLIGQVLINLLKNAARAAKENEKPQVSLIGHAPEEEISILVKDNGKGISDEIKDQIFLPFFTTYEDGSGIGLSLSRQIMMAHKGSISFETHQSGTTFRLGF